MLRLTTETLIDLTIGNQMTLSLTLVQPSIGWDYLSETVVDYVPFRAYRHNFATGQKEQMFQVIGNMMD